MRYEDEDNCLIGITPQGTRVLTPLFVTCSGCDGEGIQETTPVDCPLCKLSGEVQADCTVCHGSGKAPAGNVTCPDCKGEGRVPELHNIGLITSALNATGFFSATPTLPRFGK